MGGLSDRAPSVEPTADSRSCHSRMAVLLVFWVSSDRAGTELSGQLPNAAWGHMVKRGECFCQFGSEKSVCEYCTYPCFSIWHQLRKQI